MSAGFMSACFLETVSCWFCSHGVEEVLSNLESSIRDSSRSVRMSECGGLPFCALHALKDKISMSYKDQPPS